MCRVVEDGEGRSATLPGGFLVVVGRAITTLDGTQAVGGKSCGNVLDDAICRPLCIHRSSRGCGSMQGLSGDERRAVRPLDAR